MSRPQASSRTFQVEQREANRRLGDVLADRFGWVSRLRLRRLVRDGCVSGELRSLDWGSRLTLGETIAVSADLSAPCGLRPEPIPLRVVYEDDEIVAVDKPAGMLVHATLGVSSGTLANALAHRLKSIRFSFVNRLDRQTSGLVVAAKTPQAAKSLGAQFRARAVKKEYLAVVAGILEGDSLEVDAPIGRVSETKPHWNVSQEGKDAHTRLVVVERRENVTLVRLEPETGRTNQLRIHCAAIGHPIFGDVVYGAPAHTRLMLHALRLELRRPADDQVLRLTAELPGEF